jgi:hypothetical protein
MGITVGIADWGEGEWQDLVALVVSREDREMLEEEAEKIEKWEDGMTKGPDAEVTVERDAEVTDGREAKDGAACAMWSNGADFPFSTE